MSKKIENILEKAVPLMLSKKKDLVLRYDNYAVEKEIKKEISENITPKLRTSSMRELTKVRNQINDVRAGLSQTLFKTPSNLELETQLEQTEMKYLILNITIDHKQEYQKQFTHPVERNIISHGVFSPTSPNETTMKGLRNSQGVLEQVRNGFRRLYYRNENGNFLTTFDTKIFIGLMKLWELKGKNQHFSLEFKELFKVMESEATGGGDYDQIAKSLENLAKTSIIMEEYADPISRKKTSTHIHNPIQNASIIHNQGLANASIEFNSLLHNSLLAGNYVFINMGLFNDLATPTSKHLYLYITNELPEGEYTVEIDPLISHLNLTSSTRTKAVNLLKDAFTELKDFDVLQHFEVNKEGRFYKSIRYTPSNWLVNQPKPQINSFALGLLDQ